MLLFDLFGSDHVQQFLAYYVPFFGRLGQSPNIDQSLILVDFTAEFGQAGEVYIFDEYFVIVDVVEGGDGIGVSFGACDLLVGGLCLYLFEHGVVGLDHFFVG